MSPTEAEEGADGAADVATVLVALCAVAEPFRVRWDILRLSADSSGPLDPTTATKCQLLFVNDNMQKLDYGLILHVR